MVLGSFFLLFGVVEELVVCYELGVNDLFCDLGFGIIVSLVILNGFIYFLIKYVCVGFIGGVEGDIGVFVEVVGGLFVGFGRYELDIFDFG